MIEYKLFSEINLEDTFFDSLKADYKEFSTWFNNKSKQGERAFLLDEDGLQAFLYLKVEDGIVNDVQPPLAAKKRIKIGTMKINPHGTRLGERFIKVAFNIALKNDLDEIYVTVFEHHKALVGLFTEFGFSKIGEKVTSNGLELVLLKNFTFKHNDISKDFPVIDTTSNKYLLGIYPQFHSILFPDSILNNEHGEDIIMDISHTNSIHKIYICKMSGVSSVKRGDNIIIYRTAPVGKSAWYHSVATTVCVAEEVKIKSDFSSEDEYIKYCSSYSIFNEKQLKEYFNWYNLIVIKFLYNASFSKRINRQRLIEEVGLSEHSYWGFMELSDSEYFKILELGQVNKKLIR
ncbi:hypothetical protein [Aliarcobacter butzleri]|uniref:hypothetical protein n=1 Tax=Aliarcobacter butzleri TaxID=28197 RepID=UPI002B249A19|nr:hypothetical protein [Aliarcobacter butzleri]